MKMFVDVMQVYLHREPVDFRKSINGLSLLVEQQMAMSPFSGALFVFCNRPRNKIKALYWDNTGFCLWYKRLEQEYFKWPSHLPGDTLTLSQQQWDWLLAGVDITKIKEHKPLHYVALS
ncbi:IS66 family insertion sequence element accessory protein TnpB [Enterobacter bugandensis]|uniref:IS66 family insertion sequence element accessory protein TnpB n=1 Tax=Enterobacter bugandensis TaxID=881260 RepID=UPI002362536B|nr:IS66 family insertion sequence element accessory protein TnpB [Enterobacter bugandensis]